MPQFLVVRHEAHTGLTGTATAAVTQGDALRVSGAKTFAPATAGQTVVGVAHHTVASGETVTARLLGDILPMRANGVIAAGDRVKIGAVAGTVETTAVDTDRIGVAWTASTGAGQTVNVILL